MSTGRRSPWAHSPRTFVFAAGVGVIGGIVGTLFQTARGALQDAFVGEGDLLTTALAVPWYHRFLLPFAGTIAAALLAYGLTRRSQSQGMSDVMEAVSLRRVRRLRPGAAIARALSSLALLATGGSVGREGPIVYMSAIFGSRFSQLARVPRPQMAMFSGCGVAAGLSAAYYAPLGAALFAMEVVLGNFAVEILAPVILASVIAFLICDGFATGPLSGMMKASPLYDLGNVRFFPQEEPGAFLVFLVLGVVAALVVWSFLKCMRETERVFRRIPVSPLLRLPLGGLFLGAISVWLPHVWGGGHDTVNYVFRIDAPVGAFTAFTMWEFVGLLLVAKIVATAITIGAGGSGGMFTPNICVGAFVGLLVGQAAQGLFPALGNDPRAYGVVGMAAGLAAATQAPVMAIFFLFEMTQDTHYILPLILAAISASVTARRIGLDSIYLAPLRRRGLQIPEGIEETTLMTTRVKDLLREEAVWIRDSASFDMIVGMVQKTRRDSIYVVDADGRLVGAVRLHDIKNFLADQELGPAVIASDLVVDVPSAEPDQSLAEVLGFFDDPELHEIPVVDAEGGNVVGLVDRRDVIAQLSVEVLHSQQLRAKFVEHAGAQHYVEMPPGHALSRIPVPSDMVGQSFAGARFRSRTGLTVLTVVHDANGREVRLLPEPGMELHAGDFLIVMGPTDAIRKWGGRV